MLNNVIGPYRIIEKLGEGGMGVVYRAIDTMLEREVAIKSLHSFLTQDTSRLERFRSEAVTLAKLNHSNIAMLHNFFEANGDYYMVMEYVEGETFDDLLRRMGAIPLRQALELFCQALRGFEHAHVRKVIHRDIKPGNLMLDREGLVKITDFGIARVMGTGRLTKTGKLIGTLEYMSPEQVQGAEQDARSDIYSLGILLYEMVTGQVPFSSTSDFEIMKSHLEVQPRTPREFVGDLPTEVERAIQTALEKDPARRFQTAGEFRAVLEPVMERLPKSAAAIAPQIKPTRMADVMGADAAGAGVVMPPTVESPSATAGIMPPQTGVAPTSVVPSPNAVRRAPAMPSWLSPKAALVGGVTLLLAIAMVAATVRARRPSSAPLQSNTAPAVQDASALGNMATNSASPKGPAETISLPPPPDQGMSGPASAITPIPEPMVKPAPVARPKSVEQPKSKPVVRSTAKPTPPEKRRAALAPRPVRRRSRSSTRSVESRSQPRRTRRAMSARPKPRRRVISRRTSPTRRPSRPSGGGKESLRRAIKNL